VVIETKQGMIMQKIDDGKLLVHDHLVSVLMDLIEAEDDEDMALAKSEMSDMVELMFESLQISFSSKSESEDGIVLQCEVTIPAPQ